MRNHPSGDPKPSRDDVEMTCENRKAAEALGISIRDHLWSFNRLSPVRPILW
jgi:DNA repair protein RadC